MMHTKPAMMEKEKILVWWNINSCPIPSGVDAREVGSRIESALKKAGYSGPLTITFIGDMRQCPFDKVVKDLSSSGITLIHTQDREVHTDLYKWIERNPPPANIMIICGCLELECIARTLYCLDWDGYDILLAYPAQEGQVSELIEKSFLSVVRRKWFLPDFLDSGSPDQTRILPHTGLPQWCCSGCYGFAPRTFEEFAAHIKLMDKDEHEPIDEDEDELMTTVELMGQAEED